MTPKTKWEFILAVLCVTGLGLSWHEAGVARETDRALEAQVSKKAALEEQLTLAARRRVTAEQGRTELQSFLDGMHRLPKKKPVWPFGVVEVETPEVAAAELQVHKMPWRDIVLQRDPKLQALYLQAEPARLAARYASFLQAAGLSADQAEKFRNVMMENSERMLDLKVTAGTMDLPETDPAIVKLQQQAADQLRTAQTALLGESGYQQLQQYEREVPVRDFVGTLAGSLAFTETPLTASQTEQLVRIMANANAGYQNGGKADPPLLGDAVDSLMMTGKAAPVIDSDAVLKQARSVLSEPQYAQFEARISGNQSVVQLFNLMLKAPGEPMVGFVFGRR